MWDWWPIRNDFVPDGFEDWGLRRFDWARERNIHLGRVSAVAEILQGRVRWIEKIKRWDYEEGRRLKWKGRVKSVKSDTEKKRGRGQRLLLRNCFCNTQGELCKKGETFFWWRNWARRSLKIIKQWERGEQNELIEKVFLCKMAGLVLAGLYLLIFQAIKILSHSRYLFNIQLWRQRKDNLNIFLI